MKYGLTMLTLDVETENGEVYHFGIDSQKTIVRLPGEDKAYTLISSGPIAIGWELRGMYKKRTISGNEYKFESTKVTNIVANFSMNMSFK